VQQGNARRKTESTDANATSSRSHAVLSAVVTKRQRLGFEKETLQGKLTLVDLAGSERASETRNRGKQLKDSANINTSVLPTLSPTDMSLQCRQCGMSIHCSLIDECRHFLLMEMQILYNVEQAWFVQLLVGSCQLYQCPGQEEEERSGFCAIPQLQADPPPKRRPLWKVSSIAFH
jgi:hypothetical protein